MIGFWISCFIYNLIIILAFSGVLWYPKIAYCPIIHRGQQLKKEGKIEGIIFRNRGQREGILKGNREQNLFAYVQRFKGPDIPKPILPSKYTIFETPAGTT